MLIPDMGEQPAYGSLAELVFAVDIGVAAATFEELFQWLVDHVPELNEAWSEAQRDLGGGLTLLDVITIRRWAAGLHTKERTEPRRRVATAVKLFELHSRTREMWAELRQTAQDAGLLARWPDRALEAAGRHRRLAELAASDDPESLLAKDRRAADYLPILEHRLHRGEGDVERNRRLHDLLRRELSRVPLKVPPRRAGADTED